MGAVPDVPALGSRGRLQRPPRVHVVYGHDFRDDFRWLGGDVPSELGTGPADHVIDG